MTVGNHKRVVSKQFFPQFFTKLTINDHIQMVLPFWRLFREILHESSGQRRT
jgi:hypothetical protein